VFTNKKRERIKTLVCALSLYVTETPEASVKDHEPPLPIIPFGIVAYGFVGQPFSKQLYTSNCLQICEVGCEVIYKTDHGHSIWIYI